MARSSFTSALVVAVLALAAALCCASATSLRLDAAAAAPQMGLASTAALERLVGKNTNVVRTVSVEATSLATAAAAAHPRNMGARVAGAVALDAVDESTTTTTAAPTVLPYGSPLTAGVIASISVALVFGAGLVVLVVLEGVSLISDYMDHRRMRATRKASPAENPAEPHCGEQRNAAADVRA